MLRSTRHTLTDDPASARRGARAATGAELMSGVPTEVRSSLREYARLFNGEHHRRLAGIADLQPGISNFPFREIWRDYLGVPGDQRIAVIIQTEERALFGFAS